MHSFAFYLSSIWSRLCAGSQMQEAQQRSRVFQLLVHVLPFSYSEPMANIVNQSNQVFDISLVPAQNCPQPCYIHLL